MADFKCGRCGMNYSFEEYMGLEQIKAVADDPDPKKNYGYTKVCGCGYVFHQDSPLWKAYGRIEHHITILHWLVNKLTNGWLARPSPVDVELSTVFLEIAHDRWREEPNWYESMFFTGRPEGKVVECYLMSRYRTEEQAIEGHKRWKGLLEDGKYLITYALVKVDDKDPESKYRFEWHIDFNERHRRILHGAKIHREMEGTISEYRETLGK